MSLVRYGGTGGSSTPADIADHINDTVDAHDASAISFVPVGTIAATDMQTALAEVATDYAAADADILDGATFTGNVVSTAGFRVGTYGAMTINGATVTSDISINRDTYCIDESHASSNTAAISGIRYFARSRGTGAAPSVVQSGDILGAIHAVGYDSVDYALSASMSFEVDGTPGANDMPGRIVFSTSADGAQTPTERLRISANGTVAVTGNLTVSGTIDKLTDHLNDTSDAHGASAISYAGGTGMSATDVEAAIDELATEKQDAETRSTFTPNDASGASLSLAIAAGSYTKIGRTVNFRLVVQYPATGSGSNAKIGGLPFTSSGTISSACAMAGTETTAVAALVDTNALTITLYTSALGNVTNATMSGDVLYITGTYEATS